VKVRVCAEPDCGTQLSRVNPYDHCWHHQTVLELTGQRPPLHVPPPKEEAVPCSPRFRKGIPGTYAIPAVDVDAYRTGAWLGAM
jgi:hypothetical protein